MDIDIATDIAAVDRTVENREHQGRPARVVVVGRSYAAPVADVWDAITSPERIPRWFLPVSGDLRLGGRYQLEGNAGGTITACEPPHHLALDWEFGGEVSWVDVRLSEEDGGAGTRLRLEHVAPLDEERWAEFGPGAVGVGWDLGLLGLDQHLSTGGTVEGGPWMATAQGQAFMRASSDEWGRASIASGTPEDAALAAAGRTSAAYAGD